MTLQQLYTTNLNSLTQEDLVKTFQHLGFPLLPDPVQDESAYITQFEISSRMVTLLAYRLVDVDYARQMIAWYVSATVDQQFDYMTTSQKQITEAEIMSVADAVLQEEQQEENNFYTMYELIPKEYRPHFLFIYQNQTEPPLNFSEETHPEYFNIVPDAELQQNMTQAESDQLQRIMQQQIKRNSGNPGYNQIITPDGVENIVDSQQPAQSLLHTQTQIRVPQRTQNIPVQPAQSTSNQQPQNRNRSLNDLLQS